MVKKEYFVTALIAAVVSSLVTAGTIMILSAPSSPIGSSSAAKPHFSIVGINVDRNGEDCDVRIWIINDGDATATDVVVKYDISGMGGYWGRFDQSFTWEKNRIISVSVDNVDFVRINLNITCAEIPKQQFKTS